jgi:hypothetical protein
MLPVQDIGEAIKELCAATGEFGMVGAMLPAISRGPLFGSDA